MAKKTSVKRVHQLAKELGVSSKDIVSKCQAEEIPDITNHMSAISVGLAVTVREWFGGGSGESTAVETAAPVDVAAARKKAPRRAKAKPKAKSAAADTDAPTEDAVAVAEPAESVVKPAEKKAASRKAADDPAVADSVEPVSEPLPAADSTSVAADSSTSTQGLEPGTDTLEDSPVMNVPKRPEVISPAGEQLTEKKKVKLSGPVVVRVEQPDAVAPPRAPRPPRSPGGDTGGYQQGGPRTGGGVRDINMPDLPPTERGRGSSTSGRRRDGRGETGRAGDRRGGARSDRRRDGRSGRSFQGAGGDDGRSNWRDQDLLERDRRLSSAGGFFKRHRQDRNKKRGGRQVVTQRPEGPVKVTEPISIKELSAATGVKGNDILKQLFLLGVMTNINSTIDTEQAHEIMANFDIELEVVEKKSAAEVIEQQFEARDRTDERLRSPVVTILGHVDHGKTSLLDKIRNANVADGEAGGITQATSAFRVPVKAGDGERLITFIDTPGHEAFTSMRARGARVTDVVVLVVAADDGVMPQTVESISHAKAAGVPIVVALNKIDRPDATEANVQRILGQLAEHELNPVEWGGGTEVVKTSAINGDGIQELLDVLDYQAELLELKADFTGNAEGTVLEAKVEDGRGPVASVLVQEGQLTTGSFIVSGRGFGRVRDMVDDHGARVQEAGPSTPIALSGLDEVPDAGDKFYIVDSLKAAENAAEECRRLSREQALAQPKVTLDNIFDRMKEVGARELPLIVKGDVQGSVETLKTILPKISTDEVRVVVKHSAVGGISESDISLAEASGAIVVGFNVTTSAKARALAEQRGVDFRLYEVIYDLTDDVEKAAAGLLDPELKLEVRGHAEVREVFKVSKVGMIAGCYVTDGAVERNLQIRVTRDGIVVESDRRLEQLKRFKDDVKEVKSGVECGMKIEGYDDIKVGDVLECYKTIEVARTL
ncbi:MAG: translation initiation factor IF-2 [Planctomycetota bacterium]|nr:translation initiation factor IF-2 [Planctomycetota bacterium]